MKFWLMTATKIMPELDLKCGLASKDINKEGSTIDNILDEKESRFPSCFSFEFLILPSKTKAN